MDIWEMARAAIGLIAPHLRAGAIVVADNSARFRDSYKEYFEFLCGNGFATQTLPFAGGLELSVKL